MYAYVKERNRKIKTALIGLIKPSTFELVQLQELSYNFQIKYLLPQTT